MSDRTSDDNATRRGNERRWRSRGKGRGMRGTGSEAPRETYGPANFRESTPQSANTRTPTAASSEEAILRRRMNLMASVSRSSGLEKDGDDLKNYKTQEEYRNFIQEKVDLILVNHRRLATETEIEKKHRIDAQQNLLILFRKLREGLSSSSRKDAFAMEAYETSLYLSILFESPTQTTSVIPHLFPSTSSGRSEETDQTSWLPSIFSLLITLLHQLVTFYPSQEPYWRHFRLLSDPLLPKISAISVWLQRLTRSLRTRNYAEFALLSKRSALMDVLATSLKSTEEDSTDARRSSVNSLGLRATLFLVEGLRKKASDSTWAVIRSAYRELACDSKSEATKRWLGRSLCLESVVDNDPTLDIETWLETKAPLGHVRKKDGVEGRWIICKVR